MKNRTPWLRTTQLGLFLLTYSQISLQAVQAEEIEVLFPSSHEPPVYIHKKIDSQNAPKGIVNIILKAMGKDLSGEYKFKLFSANSARMQDLMVKESKGNKVVCAHSYFATPERKKLLYLSNPIGYTQPGHLIIRAEDESKVKAYINKAGKVDLEAIFKKTKLKLGKDSKRSLFPTIDQLVAEHPKQVKTISASNHGVAILKMLAHKRGIDMMIDYPINVIYKKSHSQLLAGKGPGKDKFKIIPIAQVSIDLIPLSLACARNEASKKFLKRANRFFREKGTDLIHQAYKSWVDENSKKLVDKHLPMFKKYNPSDDLVYHP